MPLPPLDQQMPTTTARKAVLELTVRNHPGVMMHVCSLFARRAYNVEAIFCVPIDRGETSRIVLLVNEDRRLDQMLKQVRKLEDVLATKRGGDAAAVLERLQAALP